MGIPFLWQFAGDTLRIPRRDAGRGQFPDVFLRDLGRQRQRQAGQEGEGHREGLHRHLLSQ